MMMTRLKIWLQEFFSEFLEFAKQVLLAICAILWLDYVISMKPL